MKFRRLASLLLVMTLCLSACLASGVQAEIKFPLAAITDASPSLKLRPNPNTSGTELKLIPEGLQITLLEEVQGESVNGDRRWYRVRYNGQEGYVSAAFVKLTTEMPSGPQVLQLNPKASSELMAKGFPRDYAEQLAALSQRHPNWVFTPLHTNYSFKTAVQGEDQPGVNLVPANSPDQYKSDKSYDYDRYENVWKQYEPGWVGASTLIIAQQMDPRHFLDEVQIFQFENLQYNPAYHRMSGLQAILSGTFMQGSGPVAYLDQFGGRERLPYSYAELFMKAAELSGVSPYHLASRARQELSPNGSDSVSGSYQGLNGYYNFYNIGAYSGADPVYSGLLTARDGISGYSNYKNQQFLFPWTDPDRAISGGAIFLGKDYISVDQNTLYLQKFNLSSHYTRPFEHQYMGNVLAPEHEAVKIYQAYREMGALQESKEFIIPVFTEMPDSVLSAEEGQQGNPNNWLSSLKVNTETVAGFSPNRYNYELEVSTAQGLMTIEAEGYAREARIEGTGTFQLEHGKNEFVIKVTASNGDRRNYHLTVNYGRNLDVLKDTKVDSRVYALLPLGLLYGADPAKGLNRVEQLLSAVEVGRSLDLSVLDAGGAERRSGSVGTGSVLRVKDEGKTVADYRIVIRGDVNGDGGIDLVDANQIFQYAMGLGDYSQTQILAMDANRDGSKDLLDANAILGVAMGLQSLTQEP